jgi:hypothetical protein
MQWQMIVIVHVESQCTKFQVGGNTDFVCPFIWSPVSGLVRFLTADQKQLRVGIYEGLRHIASDNAAFLSSVITGDESWIYSNEPETKQQSSQWKGPNIPRPKKCETSYSYIKEIEECHLLGYDAVWLL